MKKISMVVTDLDGTLLRGDKTVSDRTRRAIREARARGIRFAFATARPLWWQIDRILEGVEYDGGIYHNGAVVTVQGVRIADHPVQQPLPLIRRILAARPGTEVWVELDGVSYANFPAERIWPGIDYVRTDFAGPLPSVPAYKVILGCTDPRQMESYRPLLDPGLHMQMSEGVIAMIMDGRASKLQAVTTLAEHMGIPLGEVAAIGDDLNDLDMLAGCGWGVAVANALTPVREAADEVTGSNEEDGVALWMENQGLCGEMRAENV